MKRFLTFEEQIDSIREKDIIISENDELKLKKALIYENYYNIINGYIAPFKNRKKSTENKDIVIKGTDINEILELYYFDMFMRHLYLGFILILENRIKTVVAYEFSKLHQDEPEAYLNQDCYTGNKNEIKYLLDDIRKQIDRKAKEKNSEESFKQTNYITHYKTKYKSIPLWVAINCFTLGTVNKIYSLLGQNTKLSISKYFNLSPNICQKFISHLTLYRNICAHNERFYCTTLNQRIPDHAFREYYNKYFHIPPRKGNIIHGFNDVFSLTMVMVIMLDQKDRGKFINELSELISILSAELHTIKSDLILKRMGFPKKWAEISNIDFKDKTDR